jgi:imidazolonepropionase-like amidohydrolase
LIFLSRQRTNIDFFNLTFKDLDQGRSSSAIRRDPAAASSAVVPASMSSTYLRSGDRQGRLIMTTSEGQETDVTRIVLSGGQVFDGTGAAIADGDVVVADGRILDVGTGLDGDEQIDVSGLTVLPGFIDCHVHVISSGAMGVRGLQAMGTDSGVGPHGRNLDELALMAAGGMKPAAVLASATSAAAQVLGLADTTGTIAPGKRADLVIVDGDPYDFSGLKQRIRAVFKDGRRVRGTS